MADSAAAAPAGKGKRNGKARGRPQKKAHAARLVQARQAAAARGAALSDDWSTEEAAAASKNRDKDVADSSLTQYQRIEPRFDVFLVAAGWGQEKYQLVDDEGEPALGTMRRFIQHLDGEGVPYGTMDTALKWLQYKYRTQLAAQTRTYVENFVRRVPGVKEVWDKYQKASKGSAADGMLDIQAGFQGDLTPKQIIEVSILFLSFKVKGLSSFYHVQGNAEKNWLYGGAMRSEGTRLARPAFLFERLYRRVGLTSVGIVSNGGKLNDAGRPVVSTVFVRRCVVLLACVALAGANTTMYAMQDSRNPLLCPKGSLGLLLLHRHFVLKRFLPDWLRPETIFKKPLFSNVKGDKHVPYDAQLKWCHLVYAAIGATPGAASHHWRGLAARLLAEWEVPEDQAKLLLHHLEQNVHGKAYAHVPSHAPMLVLAGFEKDDKAPAAAHFLGECSAFGLSLAGRARSRQ